MKIVTFFLAIFLLVGLAYSASLRSKRQATSASECNPTSSHDVVIIGAGIAGLSAAVELYTKRNITNIAILEARDRIGGRIYTIRHDDNTFEEYGAQWVHGTRGSEMMKYLNDNGLFLPTNEKPDGEESWYNLNGTEIADNIVEDVWDKFDDLLENINGRSNVSFGDQLKRGFANWLRRHPGNGAEKQAVFNFAYNDQATDSSEDMVKISPKEYTEYDDVHGDDLALIKDGYFNFVDRYTAGLPLSSIVQFKAVVKKINYNVACGSESANNKKKVAVYLNDGRVFVGKTVIVTLPLGVLKAGTVEFAPALPTPKQTAISRLGYGCAAKIFLFFRNRWWGNNAEVMALFLDSIADGIEVQSSLYKSDAEAKWYRQLTGFNVAYGNDLILQGWLTGDWAKLMERLPLDEVTSVVNQILTKAFSKDFQVEQPYKVIKSDWCGDPFTMGGYPYLALGARVSDFTEVAKPVPNQRPNLFFAGDETHESSWSCVHGALSTGIRAAGQAVKAMRAV